jgi:hypothetical protein
MLKNALSALASLWSPFWSNSYFNGFELRPLITNFNRFPTFCKLSTNLMDGNKNKQTPNRRWAGANFRSRTLPNLSSLRNHVEIKWKSSCRSTICYCLNCWIHLWKWLVGFPLGTNKIFMLFVTNCLEESFVDLGMITWASVAKRRRFLHFTDRPHSRLEHCMIQSSFQPSIDI